MIDTQTTISNSTFTFTVIAANLPMIVAIVWLASGKQMRRWWRRRKLNIPNEEGNVRTLTGPLWEIAWVRVSEVKEKRPDDQRSTVLGETLPQAMQVLKAKYGDEFDEKNVRSASKQSYTNVIVGIPDTERGQQ